MADHVVGERLTAGDLFKQDGLVTPVQTIEREHCHLRRAGPGRLKFRAVSDQRQHRQLPHTLDQQIERFQRAGVGPVQILEQQQHRLLPRQTFQLIDQRDQRLLPPLRRTEPKRRIAVLSGQRQQRGEQRRYIPDLQRR